MRKIPMYAPFLLLSACRSMSADPAWAAVPSPAVPHAEMAPLSDAPDASGYGAMRLDLVKRLTSVQLIDHVKMGYDPQGILQEVSIYHNDPQPIGPRLKQAIHDKFPNSQVVNYETEWESDVGAVTEATVKTADGRICEISVTSSGDTRFTECIIDEKELPAAVRTAALKMFPDGKFLECEYREEKRGAMYETELRAGTVIHVLRLTPAGDLLEHLIALKAQLLLRQ